MLELLNAKSPLLSDKKISLKFSILGGVGERNIKTMRSVLFIQ